MEDKEQTLKIQKTEWIYSQIQKQREAEDALFEKIRQEQEVLDRLNQSIGDNMEHTKEARKYNREFQERMDAQVYAMYGITEDKLQGIREYKNAYYQGCAFSLFLLSVVLVVLCGVLHGFQSQICLFMIAFSGVEGTLLAQPKSRAKILEIICKILYLLMFPLMMVVFICYELGYREYHIILPWLAVFGVCVLVLGTAAYFFYNPYRKERRNVGAAKDTIREIERTARKEVRRNQKTREKSEKKQKKLLDRQAAKQQKLLEKEERRRQKYSLRAQKRQDMLEKKDNFLARFQKGEESLPAEEDAAVYEIQDTKRAEEAADGPDTEIIAAASAEIQGSETAEEASGNVQERVISGDVSETAQDIGQAEQE